MIFLHSRHDPEVPYVWAIRSFQVVRSHVAIHDLAASGVELITTKRDGHTVMTDELIDLLYKLLY